MQIGPMSLSYIKTLLTKANPFATKDYTLYVNGCVRYLSISFDVRIQSIC